MNPLADTLLITHPTTIGDLVAHFERFKQNGGNTTYPACSRFAMGLPVPAYQRGVSWSVDQQRDFLTTLWKTGKAAPFIVLGMRGPGRSLDRQSSVLVDGQERLTAIEHYVSDMICVSDNDRVLRHWSAVPSTDRERFLGIVLPREQHYEEDKPVLDVFKVLNRTSETFTKFYRTLFSGAWQPLMQRPSIPEGEDRLEGDDSPRIT